MQRPNPPREYRLLDATQPAVPDIELLNAMPDVGILLYAETLANRTR